MRLLGDDASVLGPDKETCVFNTPFGMDPPGSGKSSGLGIRDFGSCPQHLCLWSLSSLYMPQQLELATLDMDSGPSNPSASSVWGTDKHLMLHSLENYRICS